MAVSLDAAPVIVACTDPSNPKLESTNCKIRFAALNPIFVHAVLAPVTAVSPAVNDAVPALYRLPRSNFLR